MKQIDSWQLSPRVQIARGSLVRFRGGGPEYKGQRLTLPGTFQVRKVLARGKRVWLEVFGLNKTGGTYTVFVQGRAYEREGMMIRPYNVSRMKGTNDRQTQRPKPQKT